MKFYHYFIALFFLVMVYHSVVHAFEPVPIDEFFKKFPEEQGKEQDYKASPPVSSVPKERAFGVGVPIEDVLPQKQVHKKVEKNTPFVPQESEPVISEFSEIEFLVLNRVEQKTYKVTMNVGESKDILNFKITAKACRRREFPDNAHYTAVRFMVEQNLLDKKKNQVQKKVTYDGVMYLELPGLNGFEDSVFDIHPVKCLKEVLPVEISSDKDISNKHIKEKNVTQGVAKDEVEED